MFRCFHHVMLRRHSAIQLGLIFYQYTSNNSHSYLDLIIVACFHEAPSCASCVAIGDTLFITT